jgi:hypothetical protein
MKEIVRVQGEKGNGDEMKKDSKTVLTVKEARGPTVADVTDRVLDKGMVIEYRIESISLAGLELPVTLDARYIVASLDTYLAYAEPLRKTGLVARSDAWLHDLTTP